MIFEKSSLMNLIFTACVACKNQLQNRKKKSSSPNLKFQYQFLKNHKQITVGHVGNNKITTINHSHLISILISIWVIITKNMPCHPLLRGYKLQWNQIFFEVITFPFLNMPIPFASLNYFTMLNIFSTHWNYFVHGQNWTFNL